MGEGARLGIAIALLGDPQYLVLDEPTNGLDPMGIKWFRNFIRRQADQGKQYYSPHTTFLKSKLLRMTLLSLTKVRLLLLVNFMK